MHNDIMPALSGKGKASERMPWATVLLLWQQSRRSGRVWNELMECDMKCSEGYLIKQVHIVMTMALPCSKQHAVGESRMSFNDWIEPRWPVHSQINTQSAVANGF